MVPGIATITPPPLFCDDSLWLIRVMVVSRSISAFALGTEATTRSTIAEVWSGRVLATALVTLVADLGALLATAAAILSACPGAPLAAARAMDAACSATSLAASPATAGLKRGDV